jgi:hypothetical protein
MRSKFIALASLLSAVAALQAGPAFGRVRVVASYERNVTTGSAHGVAPDVQVVKAVTVGLLDGAFREPSQEAPAVGEGARLSLDGKSGDNAR